MWELLKTRDSKYSLITSNVKIDIEGTEPAEKQRKWCFGEFNLGEFKGIMRTQFLPKEIKHYPPSRLIMTEIFFQKPLITNDLTGVEVLLSVAGSMMLKTDRL